MSKGLWLRKLWQFPKIRDTKIEGHYCKDTDAKDPPMYKNGHIISS